MMLALAMKFIPTLCLASCLFFSVLSVSCSGGLGSSSGLSTQEEMNLLAGRVGTSLQAHRASYDNGDYDRAKSLLVKAEKDCEKALSLAKRLPSSDPSRAESVLLTRGLLAEIRSEYNEKFGY